MFSISYASERIRKRLHDELRIPREQAARILSSIEKELNTFDPRQRSPRIKKLTDSSRWRLKVGDYRVIFIPDFKKQTIAIMAISQRGNAYD
jgi:mRNA-degrading endonuclease RelE of RelBE toxin-antitoxin system